LAESRAAPARERKRRRSSTIKANRVIAISVAI
jgi:hypothetical protein